MKRFMKRTDLTSLWEADGDLKRMKAFFHTVQSNPESNEQIKQSIKQKALEKMANEEARGRLPIITKEGLVYRIRTRLRTTLGYRHWKLGIPVVIIAMLVILGQGVMNGSFNLTPSIGNTEKLKSTNMVQPTPGAKRASGNESNSGAMSILPAPVDPAFVPPAEAGIPRKITQDMSLTLEVAALDEVVSRVSKEVLQLGGYVTSSQQNGSDKQSFAQMTVKIPAEKLNGLRDSLSTWGKILDQRLRSNDITNQYYDAQARLKTLELQEKRYLEILNQAKTVEDVLKVENALVNVRIQIEQLKGQLKLWNNNVEYSTLNLQLVTLQSPNLNVKNPWQPISWSNTWQATQDAVLKTLSSSWNAVNYFVVGLGYAFPYLIVCVLVWAAYRIWKKRTRG